MKGTIILSIETHGDATAVEMRYGKIYSAAVKRWNGKPRFPFGTVVKCALNIFIKGIKRKLNNKEKGEKR